MATTTGARAPLPAWQQAVVIGGGQTGLATAAALQRRGVGATVLAFPGHPDHHPHKDEVADYLDHDTAVFGRDVRTSVPEGPILVVGGGNSGFELAAEFATADPRLGRLCDRQLLTGSSPRSLRRVGVLLQHRGRTPLPGLHAVGQPWQRDRGSALLGFVGRDAAEVAERVSTCPSPEHAVPHPRAESARHTRRQP